MTLLLFALLAVLLTPFLLVGAFLLSVCAITITISLARLPNGKYERSFKYPRKK